MRRRSLRDQEDLFEHCQASQRALLTFGYHPESDIRILEQNGRGILLSSPGGNQIKIQSQFAQHAAFPINAAAAAATALAAGVSQDAIVEGLANYLPPSGRYQVINLNHDRVLIDDSYNASKESVSAGIMSVVQNYQKRGKTIILGDILESGASWRETHCAIGSLVTAADNIKRLILVGDKAKFIGIQAAKSGLNSEVIQYYDDVDELLAKVDTLGDLEGVCYIKGSNRVGLWKFVPVLKKLYGDDRAVSPFNFLSDDISGLNVGRYITFRAMVAMLSALVISFLFSPWFIRRLKQKQIGQVVRDDGPESHFSKKGTPTMGGGLSS